MFLSGLVWAQTARGPPEYYPAMSGSLCSGRAVSRRLPQMLTMCQHWDCSFGSTWTKASLLRRINYLAELGQLATNAVQARLPAARYALGQSPSLRDAGLSSNLGIALPRASGYTGGLDD